MPEATFSIAIARDIIQYVVAQGVEAQCLYGAAKIEPTWLNDPDRQISGEVLRQLWREAVSQTGDQNLGLHIGAAFDLSAIGIVGYVLLNCQTYRQVLEKLSQYTRLFSQGVAVHHRVLASRAQCDFEIVGNIENYLLNEPRQPIESTFAALISATQQLTGKKLLTSAVSFQHSLPESGADEHQKLFQAPVQFSQSVNRIVFEPACLSWAVRSANSTLLSVFERHADTMLSAQNPTYRQKVVEAITQSLHGEVPLIEAIARHLTLSVRQLQRELQAENTSYQQLLEDTRKALSLQHLQNPETSIHDIAFMLGFSEPSAFHRAFKRWTQQTPNSYRKSQLPSNKSQNQSR
ncbi:MAG: AraC family transcriptional regulator [Phormidesmis sp.]